MSFSVRSVLAVRRAVAAAALAAGIRRVVIDRGGFKFHGRVRALVEGAVAGGLQIKNEPDAASDSGAEKEAS